MIPNDLKDMGNSQVESMTNNEYYELARDARTSKR